MEELGDQVIYWKAGRISNEKQKSSHSLAIFSSTAEQILDDTISLYCKKERDEISRYIDFFITSAFQFVFKDVFILFLISKLLTKDSVKKGLMKHVRVEVFLTHYKFYIKRAELTNVLLEEFK